MGNNKKAIEIPVKVIALNPKGLRHHKTVYHEFDIFFSKFEKSFHFELLLNSDPINGLGLNMILRDFITSKLGYNSSWNFLEFNSIYNSVKAKILNIKKYEAIHETI